MAQSHPPRGKFSGYALMEVLGEEEAAHAQGRDVHPHLLGDWQKFIEERFELDDEQRADLERLCSNPDPRIRETVTRVLSTSGEAPHFTLDKKPDEGAPKGFVHELNMHHRSEGRPGGEPAERHNLTIAHCDADCRHWGWGSA